MEYHKNIAYNPLQRLTAPFVENDYNIVVLAPTSSGKTIVAEQFIFPTLNGGQKAIYLSPLKALTTEKLNSWNWVPFGKVAITGDYNQAQAVKESLVLMTTESLDSKTRGQQSWLKQAGVLVSDESHMLAMPKRGDAFEIGLTAFTELNPECKIIFLSATIPNAQELGKWLTTLNGKHTKVVETDWRPVNQEHHLIQMPDSHWDFIDEAKAKTRKILRENSDRQALVFVHSVNIGKQISKNLNVPFHYSKLSKEERWKIIKDFSEKTLQSLVCTSTLAYGVNLPADVGIIVGGHRGPEMVDSADIKQEAGRIGRYGLSERGDVYYLFCEKYADSLWEEIMNIPEVRSVLKNRIYFHIVSLVARRKMTKPQIEDFLSRTLAAQQEDISDYIEKAFNLLFNYGVLKGKRDFPGVNTVGRAAALMYLDPIDLHWLKSNLKNQPMKPSQLAIAFSSLPSLRYEIHLPKDVKDSSFFIGMETSNQSVLATALNHWLSSQELKGSLISIIPPYVADIDRWISGLKISGLERSYVELIGEMMKNGVEEKLLPLVELNGIGRKRAKDLEKRGIVDKESFVDKKDLAKKILPKKVFEDCLAQSQGRIIVRF